MDAGEQGLEGIHIGHYTLGRTIGKGGFARVKQARHEPTGLPVAVKIINKEKMQNKGMISKVKREIKILKFLCHPHIIRLYEVLDTTKDILVVMELARGGELYEYIQRNNSPESEVRNFFGQIMEGVAFAHLNLVAHRDLKPENILLDGNKMVKIADFGLSNLMRDGKLLRTHCGSLNYAAPEIIGKQSYEGTAVDVWSCGVILFTMLAGSLPFDEEIISILNKKVEKAEYVIPDQVSPLARDLIQRILRANPLERLRVAEIRRHPWLRKELPIYANLSFFSDALQEREAEVDSDLLETVRGYEMESLKGMDDNERIAKIIKRRMDDSFVTAYELLRDEQERTEYEKRQAKHEEKLAVIFAPVANRLEAKLLSQPIDEHTFIYGREFHKSSKIVMGVILDVFQELSIDFFVKDIDYCVLCTYRPPLQRSRRRSSHKLEEDKIFGYQDEMRFVKNELKFTLQLYIKQNAGCVVVDLKLTQGHPLVFLTFAKDFYSDIEGILNY